MGFLCWLLGHKCDRGAYHVDGRCGLGGYHALNCVRCGYSVRPIKGYVGVFEPSHSKESIMKAAVERARRKATERLHEEIQADLEELHDDERKQEAERTQARKRSREWVANHRQD